MKVLLAALLTVAGLLLGAPAPALASCAQQTLDEQIARADVVAYGKLVSIRMTFAPASPVVVFRAERLLKGTLGGDVEVFFGPTHGGAITSVDYAGAPPQAHTLYLRLVEGAYETNACSGSHDGAPTDAETAAMGAGVIVAAATDDVPRPLVATLVVAALVAAGLAVAVTIRSRRRAA